MRGQGRERERQPFLGILTAGARHTRSMVARYRECLGILLPTECTSVLLAVC